MHPSLPEYSSALFSRQLTLSEQEPDLAGKRRRKVEANDWEQKALKRKIAALGHNINPFSVLKGHSDSSSLPLS